jgi:outer membrane protein TolC
MTLILLAASAALAAPAPAAAEVPQKLLQARRDAAQQAYDSALAQYRTGKGDAEGVYRWSHRWLVAQQEMAGTKAEREAAAAAHLGRVKDLEKAAEKLVKTGVAPPLEGKAARFYVAEAEVWLAQAKGK